MKKKDLLFVDEKGLNAEKINLIKAERSLNTFMEAAERVLKVLTNEQREFIRVQKLSFIKSQIEKSFPFPDASTEFNYQSLGVSLNELTNILSSSVNWNQFVFDLDEDGHYTQAEKQPIFERYVHYADTNHQKVALSIGRQLESIIRVAQDSGFVDKDHLGSIQQALKNLLIVDYGKGRGDETLVLNKKGIAGM